MCRQPPTGSRLLACAAAAIVAGATATSSAQSIETPAYCANGTPADLPLPSELPQADYETALYQFLFDRTYTTLGWAVDREVRDTGPYLLGTYYGTHPAVRIWYSPGVLNWLVTGREDAIPNGAMIIKEMFPPPAARYNEREQAIAAQYPDDAATAHAVFETELEASLESWTVLVKDDTVSKGGWFWANPAQGSTPDSYGYPFNFPASETGIGTCIRCHASAEKELTFSSLKNIKGFEAQGDPIRFRVDDSWRDLPDQLKPGAGQTSSALISDFFRHMPEARQPQVLAPSSARPAPDPAFIATFPPSGGLLPVAQDLVQAFPGQWADHVPAAPGGAEQFITSDNCFGCHGGLGGTPSGVTMFVQTGPSYGDGYNVSEFGEWRWSPMGLAGRDPIFFAQLESELAILERDKAGRPVQQAVVNTCLSCHGTMGQRQLQIDWHAKKPGITDPNFYYPDYVYLTDPLTEADLERQKATVVDGLDGKHSVYPYHRYGNLAREGISCTICHHIDPPEQWTDDMDRNEKLALFLLNSTTGVFPYSPRDELNGPFDNVRVKPMENALGITPKVNPYIQTSEVCGTCHAINLPNVGDPVDGPPLAPLTREQQSILNQAARNGADFLKRESGVTYAEQFSKYQHSIEQATYLEWENSDFAWDPATAQSCQDCHMPGSFQTLDGTIDIPQIATQIATIQDSSYPEAEHDLSNEETDVPVRDDYRRHELVGVNVFLLEIFNQFDQILGIDKTDYETSADNGNQLAVENMLRSAQQKTVSLDVDITAVGPGTLAATVNVANKVGHRFPSGVGFRRAFLEFLVVQNLGGVERTVWGSGRTNSVGVIVDGAGAPLVTEFLDQPNPDPNAEWPYLFQDHHELIDSEEQVQIYEELVTNRAKAFTTSFIHRHDHPKDNRLIPVGTLKPGTPAFNARFGDDDDQTRTIAAFMEATWPEGAALDDPDFGPGGDSLKYVATLPRGIDPKTLEVRVTMYYQAIPPYWLHQRFSTAPDGSGTRRLYFLTSHLDLAGTPIENWKLPLVSATETVSAFLAAPH